MYQSVVYQIYTGINYFLDIVSGILFVYCLMTWFVRPDSQIYLFMRRLVDPIVTPFRPLARRLMERGLMLDISVLLAIIGVRVIRYLVQIVFFRFLL
ncbi:MAG: YggT family protein [Clostridia bacterium]|nr:YggT family protein [Clostridia bacterium]MBO4886168.1 YggT family protein [Clostridia bacterium]